MVKTFLNFIRKLKKRGFTLIELLAIIVILAIIAVITVPIVLNIIEKSKVGATKNSAYGYTDAITDNGVSNLTIDPTFKYLDKTYTAEELKGIGVSVSGDEPDEGSWVTMVNNDIVDGCLQFGDYKVIVEHGYVSEPEKGTCDTYVPWVQTIYPTVLRNIGGTIYYDSAWIKAHPVYYNPVTNTTCNSSDASSALGTSTGCMKWYAYSETYGKVNLLLDHNISDYQSWESNSETVNSTAPDNLLDVINTKTAGWSDKLARRDSYSATWTYNNNERSLFIDYSGLKARLISAEEVAYVIENDSWTRESSKSFFGSGTDTVYFNQTEDQKLKQQRNSWLFENTDDCANEGCDHEQTGVLAYWTSTPKTNTTNEVWCICNGGCLDTSASNANSIGLRPVISVPKSIIF